MQSCARVSDERDVSSQGDPARLGRRILPRQEQWRDGIGDIDRLKAGVEIRDTCDCTRESNAISLVGGITYAQLRWIKGIGDINDTSPFIPIRQVGNPPSSTYTI